MAAQFNAVFQSEKPLPAFQREEALRSAAWRKAQAAIR